MSRRALAAIPLGYYSDRHPVAGLHRTPYILAGVFAVCLAGCRSGRRIPMRRRAGIRDASLLSDKLLALAVAPVAARELAARSGWLWATAGFLFFLAEGIATYVAGTAWLSRCIFSAPSARRSSGAQRPSSAR